MTTLPSANLLVSFVISTHNRRDVLLDTLAHVARCGLRADAFETFVIDNRSADGTADAVAQRFPGVRLIRLKRNRGSCAKNLALPHARGRFIVFLDDDSYPLHGSIARMIRRFETAPRLGAAVFTVTLPDGSQECSAYPDVFIGCGTGFRRRALAQVGGLPEDFFMQAEEYDLSLRLLQAGWDVRTFDDLHVAHMKSPQARSSRRTTRLDVRNNFVVAHRYLPDPWRRIVANDWMRRYWLIAKEKGHRVAFLRGLVGGAVRSVFGRRKRQPLDPDVFEQFTRVKQIETRLRRAQEQHGLRTVLLVDLGKNVLPYWLAARECGARVVAIADTRLAGSRYRGVPVVNDSVARRLAFDAAVVANTSHVHAAERRDFWRQIDHRPVIDLFEPSRSLVEAAASDADRAESRSHQTAARSA